ncbi:hypothetical protein HMPREF3196_01933 [Bifidobacterium bifidum]|uniref:Uncharacterized protein n=1 Tax=Bifidobacterium bifidum TaxID=1681 RepID=A0A133KKM6_BIFBI|nr:hypothetical protein HMPREF3196_01933 [Bifidobacterium bifidum]
MLTVQMTFRLHSFIHDDIIAANGRPVFHRHRFMIMPACYRCMSGV